MFDLAEQDGGRDTEICQAGKTREAEGKDKVLWQIPLGGTYIPFSGNDRSPASAFAVFSSVLHAQPIQVLNLTPSRSARSCAAICCRCAESAILNSLGRRPSRWPFVVFLKLHGVT